MWLFKQYTTHKAQQNNQTHQHSKRSSFIDVSNLCLKTAARAHPLRARLPPIYLYIYIYIYSSYINMYEYIGLALSLFVQQIDVAIMW